MNKKAKKITIENGKIIVKAMNNPVCTHSIKEGETIVTYKDKKIGGNQTMNAGLIDYLEKMENRLMTAINNNTVAINALSSRIDNLVVKNNLVE